MLRKFLATIPFGLGLVLTAYGQNLVPSQNVTVQMNNNAAGQNNGHLQVQWNANGQGVNQSTESLVMFNLSTLPSGLTAEEIESASLVLYVDGGGNPGRVTICQLASAWSSSTITGTNMPSCTGSATVPITVTSSQLQSGSFIVVNVTQFLQNWISDGDNFGIMLAANAPALGANPENVQFDAMQNNGQGFPPQLQVVLQSQGTQGLQGPAGPAGSQGPAGPAGAPGANGAPGTNGTNGTNGAQGAQGPQGLPGQNGTNGANGAPGVQGPVGPTGPTGLAGTDADTNARMVFPSFFPGDLSGTWTGGQVTIDQPITILRIAATAKTPTDAGCPGAVFRFTDGTKGQDLVLAPGAYWSDSGPIVMTFAAGATLQSILRTGSSCATNTGADANLLVEYKMGAAGDTDTCPGTLCGTYCETTTSDFSNCGSCGNACASGQTCTAGQCTTPLSGNGTKCSSGATCQSGFCVNGACSATACAPGQTTCNGTCINTQSDTSNCGTCGNVCPSGDSCEAGACTCAGGNTLCAAGCFNLTLDPTNCGACGAACPSGDACVAGKCSCPTGAALCNGACIDITKNANNCGACGNVCASGQTCLSGVCTGSLSVDGAACTTGATCTSGNCSSGVCCNTACSGNSCQSCLQAVTGAPNGTCAPATAGTSCGNGQVCNGTGTCTTVLGANGADCTSDSNCASNACDALSLKCVANQCANNRLDGAETDIDCGGANSCARCAINKSCQLNTDCASNACNAFSLKCAGSQCIDGHQDGSETDVDCGGTTCAACSVGQKCLTNFDCQSGHFCNASNVCQ